MNTSVLFLIFNRPDTTISVFNTIRSAKPKRLYIASDGAREDIINEKHLVKKAREVVNLVDWDCEVFTLFREKNLGCKNAVSGAISWFFNYEDRGIILEDDILPSDSFFTYCHELLNKYANDDRVMMISGSNLHERNTSKDHSYYFSSMSQIWGWATWKRAWKLYDVNMKSWQLIKKTKFIDNNFPLKKSRVLFNEIFEQVYGGHINTWDYQWTYTMLLHRGLNIFPKRNLIQNIGFDDRATHTKNSNNRFANLTSYDLEFPLEHPEHIILDYDYDFLSKFNKKDFPSIWQRICRKIKNKVN